MFDVLTRFRKDEDGAVTVDWVILTAAVVGLAAATINEIRSGTDSVTEDTASYLDRQEPSSNQNLQDIYGLPEGDAGDGGDAPGDGGAAVQTD
ncbi:MAG: hypothetical protein AAF665_12475 [Pseudomonadota bacterium]